METDSNGTDFRSPALRRFANSSTAEAAKEFVFPFLIPTFLTVYAIVSMNTRTHFAGILDDTLFSLSFGMVYSFILAFPRFLWRFSVSFCFVFGAALFFLFVNLNFRFFHSWGQMDALKQWEDLFAIWSGIVTLMKPGDLLFGLLVPLGLWQLSLANSGSLVRKSRRALILLAIALFLGQYKLTEGRSGYSEQNPLFYVIRQKCFQLQLKYAGAFRGRSGPRRFKPSSFVPVNRSLYTLTKNSDYPFVKIPVDHPTPLSFAIPTKPNVVLVLMESVRAFESGSYGARPSFTPNIDRLGREGVLFTKFYANGAQTIRGEFAIHSSYVPNMRGGQVYIDQPGLGVKTLGMVLKDRGYSTHWIGSHPPTFDNKIKFHSQHGIEKFHYEFKPRHAPIGMGAADVDLMDYALGVLAREKEPYFAEIMTLSNHYPFGSYPTDEQAPPVSGNEIYKKYVHGIYYTDFALGSFFDKVRTNHAFDNTVFIITGDHGIWTFPDDPRFSGMVMRQETFFRLPLVLWSPAHLKHQTVDRLGSQIDIMPTVLDLLNIQLPNAFLGNSLFRDDVANRFVLMNQDTRWNLRMGNNYAYDTGPEAFMSHYPLGNSVDLEKIFKNEKFDHLYFNSEKDLFKTLDHNSTKILPPVDRTKLNAFAEEATDTFDQTLLNDQIYPPHLREHEENRP